MSALLEIDALGMSFGGITAVADVSFAVAEGEIVGLIGPNGAGKTTVFNCISGFYRPTRGQIRFRGQRIDGFGSHKAARLGLLRTFQNVRLFEQMTVVENLLVAQHRRLERGMLSGLLGLRGYRRAEHAALARARDWLAAVGLERLANREAGGLAYGQRRRLEIARCMVAEPAVLLLDEPAAGLNPQETAQLDELIARLRAEHGVSVLLIEHDMRLVMGISDRIVVLDQGRTIAQGVPEEVRRAPQVVRAYLGEEAL